MSELHRNAATIQERLRAVGLDIEPRQLNSSARTAVEAAASLGTSVGQIVKSLVFFRGEEPVIVLCAGDRRVDAERLGLRVATAKEAKAATGFAIGGIPPLGHDRPLATIIDESLRRFDVVWCAAGTSHSVFGVQISALIEAIPGADVVAV
ncbi:MAG TPA: YbaK/EbsC family protein [Solirubrobacteraceae bacterium]|jgi:prolyl-tRNA editing enzyme YbaK/EbsC (Cys-tRNA(Pro) deacylase)|nr:YbaK/EbsC family protein [Solirubrobacteraceae bacterium]